MGIVTAKLRFRQDTKNNFVTNKTILKLGEPSYETDEKGIKIGDGVTEYENLPYIALTGEQVEALIEENSTYSNPVPIVQALGGITAGMTFDEMPIETLLTKLLYPYVKPTISLKVGINDGAVGTSIGIREIGNPITKVTYSTTVTRKSDAIQTLTTYAGNASTGTPTINENGGTVTNDYTPTTAINATTTFKAVVNDGTNNVTSNQITATFVRPMYIGYVDGALTKDTIAASDITGSAGMTKLIVSKANQSKTLTASNVKFCFAYPTSYGDLKSILDPNNFECLTSFDKVTKQITCLDSTAVEYNIYLFQNVYSPSSFGMTYKFS